MNKICRTGMSTRFSLTDMNCYPRCHPAAPKYFGRETKPFGHSILLVVDSCRNLLMLLLLLWSCYDVAFTAQSGEGHGLSPSGVPIRGFFWVSTSIDTINVVIAILEQSRQLGILWESKTSSTLVQGASSSGKTG
jgi:hypothetical protein